MTSNLIKTVIGDPHVRRTVARQSFVWFFNIYFSHYVKYETADFQREMFALLEDENLKTLVFVAFRGSGKSTIVTMAYVLWAILGKQQKKYTVIAGLTQRQVRQHFQNIKRELESNEILRKDLGPFREEQDEWGSLCLIISNYDAKITAASTEQSIRGMRHGAHRPDLIVCDDVEDLDSVKTRESRDKTYRWFSGDVIPSGDIGTRVIVVGSLLHEDSLIMRLKNSIGNGDFTGTFRQYPIIDQSGICLWLGKFPDQISIETEKKKIGDYNAWMREYMLVIIPENNQLFLPEWITRYETFPSQDDLPFRYLIASADLAISESQTADYTAIVFAKIYGYGKNMKIYILPHPINQRINFPKQVETIKKISRDYKRNIKIIIESNGYQRALIEQLKTEGYSLEGIQNVGQDKASRLSLVSPYVQNGMVVFPKNGADILIQQLVGFGVEKYDDLADAFAMLISYCMNYNNRDPHKLMQDFFRMNEHLLNPKDGMWNMKF